MGAASRPSIVVTEAFSPRHIGNWALAECAMQQLRTAFPNGRFTILARDPEGVERVTGEHTIEKLFPGMPHHASLPAQILWLLPNALWAIASGIALLLSRGKQGRYARLAGAFTPRGPRRFALDAILYSDLIVSIAGESINDLFSKKLPFVLYTYWLAARLGKPVVLFPQSFGPLRPFPWRKITGSVLRRCAVVMPRDEESLRLLLSMGVPPERCPFVPDVAIGQHAIGAAKAQELLRDIGLESNEGPRVAVVPSAFPRSGDKHIKCLAGALRMFLDRHSEAQVVVLVGNRRGGICRCNDHDIAEQLIELCGDDNRIVFPHDHELSPAETKGIFGQFDLVLTCRMHMAILSTMAGTPTVALATQSKIPEYMRLCGQENRVVPIEGLDEGILLQALETTFESASEVSRQLAVSCTRLEPLAGTAGSYARDALDSYRSSRAGKHAASISPRQT